MCVEGGICFVFSLAAGPTVLWAHYVHNDVFTQVPTLLTPMAKSADSWPPHTLTPGLVNCPRQ